MRVIMLGYVVRGPVGGLTWHHLHYALGLQRLGHDVYCFEDSDDYPSCYDPARFETGTDPAFGLRYAADVFTRVGLGERWAYFDAHTARWFGPAAGKALALSREADLVVNVSGVNPLRDWHSAIERRVLVDTDPVFTQIEHLSSPASLNRARMHTHFFSFGENIGADDCGVPDDGLPWLPTRQPIVLDEWPATPGRPEGSYTTVMQWDSYPGREYDGRHYGMKNESFMDYADLPAQIAMPLEAAIGNAAAPRAELRRKGWIVRDPLEVGGDPWTYREYIRASKGEFAVAKHGYVTSRCGWFSERSAQYLASGRPAIVQDTAFDRSIPTGKGLLAFDSPETAIAALSRVECGYEDHCRAARSIAEEYFDYAKVLGSLLDRVAASSAAPQARSPAATLRLR